MGEELSRQGFNRVFNALHEMKGLAEVCYDSGSRATAFGRVLGLMTEEVMGDAADERPTADAERLRFLSEAGLALVSSLDYTITLQQVAELSLGAFCDYCIFDVFEEDGSARRVAWAHRNPKWPRLGEIGKFAPPTRSDNYPVAQVIKTGKPVFVPHIDDRWMKSIAWSEEHLDLMRALNARSVMWVPLSAHGATVGTAIFAFSDSGRHHTEADLGLGVDLGRRAGLAVVHARQYEALQVNAGKLREMTTHQRVLIDELNHRVKNTLAVVQAMATQTLRAGTSSEIAGKAFSARLMALASAHDLLARDNWEGADIANIVAELLKAHQSDGSGRFRIDGHSVRVEPRLALSIAMTLHELATNATKYGALSNDAGVVDIIWRVDEGEVPTLSLKWQETGGPPVSVPAHRGFGSRLIERQIGSDPSSSVKMLYEPTGVIFAVTTPLSHHAA